jgi:hypothetical protein
MRAVRLLFIALGIAVLPGCGTEDVVVADVEKPAVPGPPVGGKECASGADCGANLFCSKSSCGAESGTCELRPITCDDPIGPVCGCDGVTYWNDCFRLQGGVNVEAAGECRENAVSCNDDGSGCPAASASCARILPPGAPCGPGIVGVCWVLPAECPEMGGPPFMPCPGAPGPGPLPPPMCASVCEAIRASIPYHRAMPGTCQ